MSKKGLWFVAVCPACAKRNQLEIQFLGTQAKCHFCSKKFKAIGLDSSSAALDDPLNYWIEFTAHGLVTQPSDPGIAEFGDQTNRIVRTPR